MNTSRKTVMVITPGLKGGSWTRLRDIIRLAPPSFKFYVVGYGARPVGMPANCKVVGLPYLEYSTKTFLPYHPFLSVLFSLPLTLAAYFLALFWRPHVFVCNGMIAAFSMLPLVLLFRRRMIVSYHGWTEHNVSGLAERLTIALGRHVDLIFANSEGSCRDLCRLIPESRVKVSEHYADPIYFEMPLAGDKRFRALALENRYVVFYAGRIVDETNVGALILAIPRLLVAEPSLVFLFAGEGDALVASIQQLEREHPARVHYLGYIADRRELAHLYQVADCVWSCGDDTYLTRPAVEALAAGRPILIPDRPNVARKKAFMDVRVPAELVPPTVGVLVEADSEQAAADAVLDVYRRRDQFDREAIRAYASARYSSRNLDNILQALASD